MSITSMLFLFLFLPLALAIYYMVRDEIKEYVLLMISLLFYSLGAVQYIVLFIVVIILTVIMGRAINAYESRMIKKCFLIAGILINCGILVYYKYAGAAFRILGIIISEMPAFYGVVLPLGISFFTFKAISYLVDVYSGRAVLADNPVHDALYLSFFAQIHSGPISRYNDMELLGERVFNGRLFSDGVFRFLVGFNKKVLIANTLAKITTEIFSASFENFSAGYAWLGSIVYSLQLFFDFSGYSDMAIGISGMFGYKCMENFNYPYMTESIAKFWRRWHISLSQWFRDYIYIPLGGGRNKNKWKNWFNLLIVWILTGIWHGTSLNYVVWGLGYFFAITFERITNLPGRFKTVIGKGIYRVLSLLFINFLWVLFNSGNLIFGLRYIKRMLICPTNRLADMRTVFLIKDYCFFIAIAIVLCFPIVPWFDKKFKNNVMAHTIYEMVVSLVVLAAFIWSVSFVVAGQNNPFAYANF